MVPVRTIFGVGRTAAVTVVAGVMLAAVAGIAGCDDTKPLPGEKAGAVVKKFYEHIVQARLRGGTLLVREAYKLIDNQRSKLSENKFAAIIEKYPSGFVVSVIKTEIIERHANVTVEYKVPSMFGGGYTVRNLIPLNVDEATNSWRIDFTGETDTQTLATVKGSGK